MTAFGATVWREHPWHRWEAVVWGTVDNGTALVEPPRRFLSRKRGTRWARGRVLELEHREAQQEFHRQMAALTNGVAA